jgi:hypothetical protein
LETEEEEVAELGIREVVGNLGIGEEGTTWKIWD